MADALQKVQLHAFWGGRNGHIEVQREKRHAKPVVRDIRMHIVW